MAVTITKIRSTESKKESITTKRALILQSDRPWYHERHVGSQGAVGRHLRAENSRGRLEGGAGRGIGRSIKTHGHPWYHERRVGSQGGVRRLHVDVVNRHNGRRVRGGLDATCNTSAG